MATRRDDIRNFSIIAHIDHGKSTLADRILENTETVARRDMEDQLLDNMDIERERGITIKARAVTSALPCQGRARITPSISSTPPAMWTSTMRCPGRWPPVKERCWWWMPPRASRPRPLPIPIWHVEHDLEIVPVINKIDLPSRRSGAGLPMRLKMSSVFRPWMLPRISAKTGINVEEVLERIVTDIPGPLGDPAAHRLQALIFDSYYDSLPGRHRLYPSHGRQGKARRPHPHDGYRGRVHGGGGAATWAATSLSRQQ